MSVAASDSRRAVAGDDSSVLTRIADDGVELAVWRRPLPTDLAWIDGLVWDEIDDVDIPVAISALDREIAERLEEAGYPTEEDGLALRREIAAHARSFAGIMGCDAVRLRLEIVETDACRRFHSDAVKARLLTTLVGPATQWIEAEAPERINQLEAGHVAVFKGRLRAEKPAILHRSPPIAGTGDTRLLLAIDPAGSGPEADAGLNATARRPGG